MEQQPSISAEEEQEYRRYLDQFHSSSELSEISPTDLEFYSNYLDFRNFGGGQIPDQDIQLYESISKEPFLFRNFL